MRLRHALGILGLASLLGAEPVLRAPGELPVLPMPRRPSVIPNYTELDSSTGLHMTGTPQFINASKWHLRVSGKVDHPLSLAYNELRRMPRVTSGDPLICQGNFEDYAHWAGADLLAVLEQAGLHANARTLELVGADGYRAEVSLADARRVHAFLAYEWEGKALPELHGYPVRAIFPGTPGYNWVKWLTEIHVQ